MERRDVLKSASTLAAASAVGMAGCSGILGGGCDTPGDNLEDSFPDSGDYDIQGNGISTTDDAEGEDLVRTAAAFYSGPDDDGYLFAISELSSEDVASEQVGNISDSGGFEGSLGYIQTGAYVYTGGGPDESSVEEFMSTSPTLGDCVSDNIEFV